MSCGIYKITNLINQKSYIGQSISIEDRWKKHKNYPLKYSKYPLYQAFNKYGIQNFSFEILELCDISQLNEKEIFYIKKYNTYTIGYNQTLGGSGTHGNSIKLSIEDIEIIYDLLQYSSISQNDIAKQFQVGPDTISEINQGKTRVKEGYIYPLRQNKKPQLYCIDCGIPVKYGLRCINCSQIQSRKVDRPSREQLKEDIRKQNFSSVGRKYSVSDNTIRKWCINYNLPFRAREIKLYSDQDWKNL